MATTMQSFNVRVLNPLCSGYLMKQSPIPSNMLRKIRYNQFVRHSSSANQRGQTKSRFYTKIAGLSACALGVGYISFKLKQNYPLYVSAAGSVPSHKPIRSIRHDSDKSGLKLTLYQYQTCPFCCKARALLDYYGFSYDVVEVNSVRRGEVKWSKYHKVPILVCHGVGEDGYVQINDSSVILSLLESYIQDKSVGVEKLHEYFPELETEGKRGKKVYEYPNKYFVMYGEKTDKEIGTTPNQRKEERKWRKWVDSWLVHTLSPNVYRTPTEALQAFRYFSEVGDWEQVFSTPERLMIIYVGAAAMYVLGKVLKRRHNLNDDVRQSLFEACDDWVRAVGKTRKFMGGDSPNLADLSVYGALSSIEGCTAFQEVLAHTKIKPWFYQMQTAVRSHQGASVWK